MLHNKNHKKLHNLEITPHDQPEKTQDTFAGFLLGVPINLCKNGFKKNSQFWKDIEDSGWQVLTDYEIIDLVLQ